MSDLIENDVVRYSPREEFGTTWCYEGTAVVQRCDDRLVMFDTYWGGSQPKAVEPKKFEVLFNTADYFELPHHSRYRWEKYAPTDRRMITSQHGLQARLLIRRGAVEDVDTQIENARQALAEAQCEVAAAHRHVAYRQDELANLLHSVAVGADQEGQH